MFDWQASSDDDSSGHRVMAKNFWIYWVVSIPLTAIILVGWRFWWKNQRAHYEMEYLQAPLENKSGEDITARDKDKRARVAAYPRVARPAARVRRE